MKCHYHVDLEAVNNCSICTRDLCSGCSHSVKGRIFCQDCLVSGAELAAMAASPRFTRYSPARAALFGLIPGMGAVYNRQYVKAVIHFAIFAGLVILGGEHEIFVFASIFFYVFMLTDAYRSAQTSLRKQVEDPEGFRIEDEEEDVNLPVWGGVLILMGVMFFLSNLGLFSLSQITRHAWPLFFIIAGAYLVFDFYRRGGRRSGPAAPPRPPPSEPPPPQSDEGDSV